MDQESARLRRELDSFVYGASHDLQEPLRKIVAFGELLERRAGPALDPTSMDYLKRMRDAAQRMTQLLEDLLKLSRAGRDETPAETVELGPLVKEIAMTLGLDTELGSLPPVKARAAQVRNILYQLLSNAAKFQKETPPRARVTGKAREDGMAEIQVADQGIGFSPDQTERIFEPFVRLHPRHVYSGSGVGLTLARKLAQANGGKLEGRGAPGQGATFILELPSA